MTEAEWLACEDPMPMLAFIRMRASVRKLRLFACACCRQVVSLLECVNCVHALTTSELYADGAASELDLTSARDHARAEWIHYGDGFGYYEAASHMLFCAADQHAYQITWMSVARVAERTAAEGDAKESSVFKSLSEAQPALLRDIFGNPFRPVTLNPAWLTSDVLALARGIYDEKAFDRMPILADALQDAGCDNPEVLNHCRWDGTHVRGCWVVDLVLGKA